MEEREQIVSIINWPNACFDNPLDASRAWKNNHNSKNDINTTVVRATGNVWTEMN